MGLSNGETVLVVLLVCAVVVCSVLGVWYWCKGRRSKPEVAVTSSDEEVR